MCFVFIWEQTATCATYSINWLVFMTEMKSVYCAVRTGSLNKAVCASSLKGYQVIMQLNMRNWPTDSVILGSVFVLSFVSWYSSSYFSLFAFGKLVTVHFSVHVTRLCIPKVCNLVQSRVFIFLHQNFCISSRLWMLKSRIHYNIFTYLRWLMRAEATPCCLMVWWDSDTCVCLSTVTLDTMQCERGAAHQQPGKSIPRTHHSRRLARQTDVNAPTPIDRGCPEWDTLLVPWTSSRCEVRSLCSKG